MSDYGDIAYDDELESAIQRIESVDPVADIEDLAPLQEFRKRGFLSVSDLVATVWCEVQYDYRLRTHPYLPPEQRPAVIKRKGAEIRVDKAKEAEKERVLKRGQRVHEKLEREIFPDKISVATVSAEDAWGLRLLTMISAIAVLLDGGKCREMPVAGFVGDIVVYGIVDEIVRSESGLRISDSKTRANGSIPREEDSLGGRLQVMLYKELLDALLGVTQDEYSLLPTAHTSVLSAVLARLDLDTSAPFSDAFKADAAKLAAANGLEASISTLGDMVKVWESYVAMLGAATATDAPLRTDDTLELVYRRRPERSSKRRKPEIAMDAPTESEIAAMDDDAQLQLAIRMSLETASTASAAIIGTTQFPHDRRLLAEHLDSVLGYWTGTREPQGVSLRDVKRCGWCEFEQSCQWRAAKAAEAWKEYQARSL